MSSAARPMDHEDFTGMNPMISVFRRTCTITLLLSSIDEAADEDGGVRSANRSSKASVGSNLDAKNASADQGSTVGGVGIGLPINLSCSSCERCSLSRQKSLSSFAVSATAAAEEDAKSMLSANSLSIAAAEEDAKSALMPPEIIRRQSEPLIRIGVVEEGAAEASDNEVGAGAADDETAAEADRSCRTLATNSALLPERRAPASRNSSFNCLTVGMAC